MTGIRPRAPLACAAAAALLAVAACQKVPETPTARTPDAAFAARTAPLGLDRAALPDTAGELAGYARRVYRDGRVIVAGQPDSAAVAALPAAGVGCVVNLRTPSEMNDPKRMPFDEAALAGTLGLDYVSVPLGGTEFPYTPAAVDSFAAALARHPDGVLVHCASGGRAAYLWTAYLMRHQGWTLDDALARGRAIGISASPLDGLLGRPTRLVLAD